jgi:hypothetical protein
MLKTITRSFAASTLLFLAVTATAQTAADDPMASCPMHAQHMAEASANAAKANPSKADGSMAHGHDVDSRHDSLGMAHAASTHSFRLFSDGGAIELRADSADDQSTAAAIRKHLEQVVAQFNESDFSTPAFVHGYRPDGVAEMERLRADIAYRYEPLERGGRIRITTKSSAALAAVHDFLRFQVTEHHTANTGKVEEDK